jgi:hypothetical protein
VGIGRYLEDRAVYTGDAYGTGAAGERRTIHLGIDIFLPAGELVCAPFAGAVVGVEDRARPKDSGPVVLLEHATPDGTPFFTCTDTCHAHPSSTSGWVAASPPAAW